MTRKTKRRPVARGGAPKTDQPGGLIDLPNSQITSPRQAAPKSWRDVLPIHPAANLFPLMSHDELVELSKDIKKHGLQSSVTLFSTDSRRDINLKVQLLDGRNRLDAMELAGIPVLQDGKLHQDLQWVYFEEEGDPSAYVISANIHRRHLTAEQKRELIGKLLKATPDKSDRQIAEATKVSHVTVGAVRTEMESTGQIDQLTKTVGKDGKARTKKRPIQPKPSTSSDRSHRGVSEVSPPTEKLTSGLPTGSISEKTSAQQTAVEKTSTQPAESNPIASAWIGATREQRVEFAKNHGDAVADLLVAGFDPNSSNAPRRYQLWSIASYFDGIIEIFGTNFVREYDLAIAELKELRDRFDDAEAEDDDDDADGLDIPAALRRAP